MRKPSVTILPKTPTNPSALSAKRGPVQSPPRSICYDFARFRAGRLLKQHHDQAFVLGTLKVGEADLLVTLLAENGGRVRGVAPSARRSRKRFGGALEPLTRVSARWSEKDGRELHRIESLDLTRSYAAMQADPARQAACAVLAEVAVAVAREGQPDPRGFRLLGAVLDAVDSGLDPWIAVRYFEFWTLRLHGMLPDLSTCFSCHRELGRDKTVWIWKGGEGLGCSECARSQGSACRQLDREGRQFLDAALASSPNRMAPHRHACRPGGALDHFLRSALESFVERPFRSYRHLTAATRSGSEKP